MAGIQTKMLTGQVALVTGGGRGIGRGIATELARAGMHVAVTARSQDQLDETVRLIEQAGLSAMAVSADVLDKAAVEHTVHRVRERFGPIDLLVNNAGVGRPYGQALWEVNPDEWWRTQEVNFRGPFLFARFVVPDMIARKTGRVVNVASGAGLGAWPYVSAYALSKAALIRMTENLAWEGLEHGVFAFAISPGVVRTEMTEDIMQNNPNDDSKRGKLSATFHSWFESGLDVPPIQAGKLVTLLASGKADVLTGRFIHVGHDIETMIAQAGKIEKNELYVLRMQTLEDEQ